jgi:hypothetical protein
VYGGDVSSIRWIVISFFHPPLDLHKALSQDWRKEERQHQ